VGGGRKVVAIYEGAEVYTAEHVSDGILLFVALSTVVQMGEGRTLVTIEEPEKGLHPRRLREMLDQIRRMARNGSRFILTTHSPVLLDEFRDHPESVLILERDENGTTATQLASRPEWVKELRDVSLGDLWYSGFLGGVPSS
jgi:predicted ATPase